MSSPSADEVAASLEDLAAAGFAVFLEELAERGLDLAAIPERERRLMANAFKAGVGCGVDAMLPDDETDPAAE